MLILQLSKQYYMTQKVTRSKLKSMSAISSPLRFASIALPVPLHKEFDYCIPITMQNRSLQPGMRVAVPFGNRVICGIITDIKSETLLEPSKLKDIERCIDSTPIFKAQSLELLKWASTYYSHPIGEVIYSALPTALRNTKPQAIYQNTLWIRTNKPFSGKRNAHKQIALLKQLEESPTGIWADALRMLGFTGAQFKSLEQQGYIEKQLSQQQSQAMQVHEDTISYGLNQEQQIAVDGIIRNFDQFTPFMLEGITGSGKTEVYIAAVKHCLSLNKQALILVPEINLTPQTFKRFQSQLGIPVAVYHSEMSNKEKLITHQLCSSGQAKVLIGTRSAIFLEYQDLGLITIDEEHDNSYKQTEGFKYSARDIAVKRAQLNQCPVILGSATPSSDSSLNILEGRFKHLTLKHRAKKSVLPSVSLEDMRALKSKDILSPRTLARIKSEIDQNNQVIIFHNRRGLAPSLMCFDCGWICHCPNCDARMTVHNTPAYLHCHHCDHKHQISHQCPECQGTNVNAVGAGTERIEQILNYYFPHTRTLRLDRDNIKNQTQLDECITEIRDGSPCLIVGTQMLAKGHDFPDVTLVVVVDADGLFFSSDFRAMEKGAQQLLQVAGRAGRGEKAGHVAIQTRQPEHSLFETLKQHDYHSFMENELRERQLCALPPFSKLMTIRSETPDPVSGEQHLTHLKQYLLDQEELADLFIAGPLAASISRKQNSFRHYLHCFGKDNKQRYIAQQYALHFIQSVKQHKLRLSIDIDPIETS